MDRQEELASERHSELVSVAESARVSVCLLKELLSDFDKRVQEVKHVQDTFNPGSGTVCQKFNT